MSRRIVPTPVSDGYTDSTFYATRPSSLVADVNMNQFTQKPQPGVRPDGPPDTGKWTVPPRPRPGRKPAEDAPDDKRKAQNRVAQRRFRDRRAIKVMELEDEIRTASHERALNEQALQKRCTELEHQRTAYQQRAVEWQEHSGYLQEELRQYRRELDESRRQIEYLKAQLQLYQPKTTAVMNGTKIRPILETNISLESQISVPAAGTPSSPLKPTTDGPAHLKLPFPDDCARNCGAGGTCKCAEEVLNSDAFNSTQPGDPALMEEDEAMETDFTHFGRRPVAHSNLSLQNLPHGADLTPPTSTESEPCGFCNDPDGGSCPCREFSNGATTSTSISGKALAVPGLRSPPESIAGDNPPAIEPPVLATGPGSCSACMVDPVRKNWCKKLAGLMLPPPVPRNPSRIANPVQLSVPISPASRSASLSNDRKLTCTDTYNIISQHPQARNRPDDFKMLERLHTFPLRADRHAPMEVDEASIANALLSLAQEPASPPIPRSFLNNTESSDLSPTSIASRSSPMSLSSDFSDTTPLASLH